jgi:hypothetical protein
MKAHKSYQVILEKIHRHDSSKQTAVSDIAEHFLLFSKNLCKE